MISRQHDPITTPNPTPTIESGHQQHDHHWPAQHQPPIRLSRSQRRSPLDIDCETFLRR
jgi:hypothetical protein